MFGFLIGAAVFGGALGLMLVGDILWDLLPENVTDKLLAVVGWD